MDVIIEAIDQGGKPVVFAFPLREGKLTPSELFDILADLATEQGEVGIVRIYTEKI